MTIINTYNDAADELFRLAGINAADPDCSDLRTFAALEIGGLGDVEKVRGYFTDGKSFTASSAADLIEKLLDKMHTELAEKFSSHHQVANEIFRLWGKDGDDPAYQSVKTILVQQSADRTLKDWATDFVLCRIDAGIARDIVRQAIDAMPEEQVTPAPQENDNGTEAQAGNLHLPPNRDGLKFITFQVWHNKKDKKSKNAEWEIKLQSTPRYAETRALSHFLDFAPDNNRAREKFRRYHTNKKFSHEWAETLCEKVDASSGQRFAALSQFAYLAYKKVPEGTGPKSVVAFEGYWATLELDETDTTPKCLLLFMGSDDPIAITEFHAVKKRSEKAPDWLAYFDPDGIYVEQKQIEQMERHVKEGKRLDQFAPTTLLGNRVIKLFEPYADAIVEVRQENFRLKKTNASYEHRISDLECQIKEMWGFLSTPKNATCT